MFIMGDENDEIKYNINTRSLLWDASDLMHLTIMQSFSASTKAIGTTYMSLRPNFVADTRM
jgi:hypothetical protein